MKFTMKQLVDLNSCHEEKATVQSKNFTISARAGRSIKSTEYTLASKELFFQYKIQTCYISCCKEECFACLKTLLFFFTSIPERFVHHMQSLQNKA